MQIRTTLCRLLLCLTVLGLTGAAIPAEGTPDEVASASSDVLGGDLTDPLHYKWWRHERARRAAELQTYLAQHSAAFASFKNEPLAIKQDALNFVGIQMIMFRLFPVIFPDIWGSPSEQMAPVGFGADPFEPGNIMPLGTGYHLSQSFSLPNGQQSVRVNYATLTCMGCHAGSVTGPNGSVIHFVGGPNPIGNFFATVGQTVNDPRYTPLNFRAALNKEPLGWVYQNPALLQQETLERALFNAPGGAEYFLDELKFSSNKGTQRINETLLKYTYSAPNAPALRGPTAVPGQLDVFSAFAANQADPSTMTPAQLQAALPAAPGPADIPAAWKQSGRPRFQWDDSIGNIAYREVAASSTVTAGDPAAVNLPNVVLAGNFTINLPPAPYPFDVDAVKAGRGKRLFDQACASCHAPGNALVSPPAETGTDPNRADVYTPFIVSNFITVMREACTIPQCFGAGGTPVPDSTILLDTGGYASIPLAGVWATAPYLHNGSVPTLYHLLTGDRPTTFFRANTTYDQDLVGFTWDDVTSSRAVLFDTTEQGHANTGHTGAAFNGGINWKAEPRKLEDLLEYLKTL